MEVFFSQLAKHINPKHPIAESRGGSFTGGGDGEDFDAQNDPDWGPEISDSKAVEHVEILFSQGAGSSFRVGHLIAYRVSVAFGYQASLHSFLPRAAPVPLGVQVAAATCARCRWLMLHRTSDGGRQ